MTDAIGRVRIDAVEAHFQPIVHLRTRRIAGYEALARLRTDRGDALHAERFVPALLEAGRGLELASRMMTLAARRLGHPAGKTRFVSVNVPAAVLHDPIIATVVGRLIARHRLPRGALVVEVTEDELVVPRAAEAVVSALRRAGAGLAMDDYGSGHATLSRLNRLRFDLVKTDKRLVHARTNARARLTLNRLLTVTERRGLPVIAEGIEDEQTARGLEALGCTFGQGFLFGRPAPRP